MKNFIKFLENKEEELAFHRSIAENPRDFHVLDVFSDYLEERGNPKAEVLRMLSKLAQGKGTEKDVSRIEQIENTSGYNLIRKLQRDLPFMIRWFQFNQQVRQQIIKTPPLTIAILQEILPHGSGIDLRWEIEEEINHFVAHNAFHVMDENGYYVDWAHFTIRIPKTNPLEFELDWYDEDARELNEQYMIQDYLEETIHYYIEQYLESL